MYKDLSETNASGNCLNQSNSIGFTIFFLYYKAQQKASILLKKQQCALYMDLYMEHIIYGFILIVCTYVEVILRGTRHSVKGFGWCFCECVNMANV